MKPSFSRHRRSGFTLVEMLVAVGILGILLVIILVPVRLAVDSMSIGKSRANLQQSAQAAMQQIETDIRHAIYVFPNEATRGITNLSPYDLNKNQATDLLGKPYFLSLSATDTGNTSTGVCSQTGTNKEFWNNPSRLDLLLPRRDANNSLTMPIQPGDTIVTYYARREKYTSANGVPPYDILDNPVMLFRTQFPFRNSDGTRFPTNTTLPRNADTSNNRYSDCTTPAVRNIETHWLSHNYLGEANLEPLAKDADAADPLVLGTHNSIIPNGVGLVTPKAKDYPAPQSLVPSTTFACQDTNNDGKIDRVTVNLAVEEYDGGNADVRSGKPNSQVFRLKRIIDLPNVR